MMMLVLMVYNRPRSAQRWMMMMGRRRECGWGEEDRATYCSWWCRSRYQKDSREATVSGCLSRACWTRLLSWLLGVTVPRDRVFRETFGRAMQCRASGQYLLVPLSWTAGLAVSCNLLDG